jgi:hypothetical protein
MYFYANKFAKFYWFLIFATIAVIGVGLTLYLYDFGTYSSVLYNETNEWSKPPISNIVSTGSKNTACPEGYTLIQGEF